MYLPRDLAASDVASATRALTADPRTALLVEDDPAVRRISSTMLQRLGFRVLSTANAEEALRLMSSHRTRIDALVSDVVLPGMNGAELADRVRFDHPDARVVLMSAHSLDTLGELGAQVQRYTLLPKPYTVEQLRAALLP